MPDLDPKEVADWFREQAKRCMEQAKEFEQMASMAEKANLLLHWGTSPGPTSTQAAPQTGSITAVQLEERIRKKMARAYKVAAEFNVSIKAVNALLEPHSKVYMAERGWLKVRE
jgi:hypothetical protein